MSTSRRVLVLVSWLALGAACSSGGEGGSTVEGGGGTTGSGASSSTGATSGSGGTGLGGTSSTGGTGVGGSATGGSGAIHIVDSQPGATPVGTGDACASSAEVTGLTPVNLIILYDKSSSMGDVAYGFDPAARWIPVAEGMVAFFAEPGSRGLQASLKFFPVDGDLARACTESLYETPDVPLAPLDQTTAFVDAVNATSPVGGTPTYPALQGTLVYAAQVAASTPGEETVVVLVTDGEPGFRSDTGGVIPGCVDNDMAHVSEAAQAGATATPPVRTYVIGIGPSLENLNAIAVAGGTEQAMMVSTVDPQQTRDAFRQALESIRGQHISCNVRLPTPPVGTALDVGQVNVHFVHGTGDLERFSYSEDCATGEGWHYDDRSAPTKIMLCPTTCDTVQADQAGQLEVELGCMTTSLG